MNKWTEEKISWFQACPRRSGFQGFQEDTVIKEEYLLLVDKVTLYGTILHSNTYSVVGNTRIQDV